MNSGTRSFSFVRNTFRINRHFDALSGEMEKNMFSLMESYTSLLHALLLPGTLTSSCSMSSKSVSAEVWLLSAQDALDIHCSLSYRWPDNCIYNEGACSE
jgi:hypothetical protein